MAWTIGIDEAGYGPNLGPLVMTSVACRVPQELETADLWHVFRTAVRRCGEPRDSRIVVGDSKLVYSSTRGLFDLETSVLATLTPRAGQPVGSLAHCVDLLGADSRTELASECWYSGASLLPVEAVADTLSSAAARFNQVCQEENIAWGRIRSVVVCPAYFNRLLDRWGTKGAILGEGLAELLRYQCSTEGDSDRVHFFVDKHGGRNRYAALLQHALPDGMPTAHQEGMEPQRLHHPRSESRHPADVSTTGRRRAFLRRPGVHD